MSSLGQGSLEEVIVYVLFPVVIEMDLSFFGQGSLEKATVYVLFLIVAEMDLSSLV